MSRLKQLVSEVHRRSLWQVLFIYVGGAWFGYEIIDAITERLALPEWLPVLAIILFIIGLPVVIATAVVQEGGPSPGRADPTLIPDLEATAPPRAGGKRRLFTWRNAIAGGVLALTLWAGVAVGWLIFAKRSDQKTLEDAVVEKSVAVLPLENMSPDPENQYFAAGIHDEILSQLAKIRDLTVTSRTSVMQYAPDQTDKDVRTIAKELGVGSVLEGSVRRAGPRVRITVQLIDGQSDAHLWSESYERELTLRTFSIFRRLSPNRSLVRFEPSSRRRREHGSRRYRPKTPRHTTTISGETSI